MVNFDEYKDIFEIDLEKLEITGGKNTEVSELVIPNGILSIGESFFSNYHKLESAIFPSSIKAIKEKKIGFWRLINLYYNGTIEDWCNIDFGGPMHCIHNFYLLDDNGDIEHNGKKYKLLTDLEIPNTITEIKTYQFRHFDSLNSVIIPGNVISISTGAFSSCPNIKTIKILKGVKFIGESAFHSCNNLIKVIISEGVETIGSNAFMNCENLKVVVIPTSVTKIEEYAFYTGSYFKAYYRGTKEEWNKISIGEWNLGLRSRLTKIYFYSENEPTETGNYWHKVDKKIVEW